MLKYTILIILLKKFRSKAEFQDLSSSYLREG